MNKDFLDSWSLIHAISGIGFGLLFFVFGLDILWAVIAGFGVALGWELIERITHDGESTKNSVTDVFVAGIIATATYFITGIFVKEVSSIFKIVVIVVLLVYIAFVVRYWYAHSYKRHN